MKLINQEELETLREYKRSKIKETSNYRRILSTHNKRYLSHELAPRIRVSVETRATRSGRRKVKEKVKVVVIQFFCTKCKNKKALMVKTSDHNTLLEQAAYDLARAYRNYFR